MGKKWWKKATGVSKLQRKVSRKTGVRLSRHGCAFFLCVAAVLTACIVALAQPIIKPKRIDFDALTVADARKLDGAEVLATFSADTPAVSQGDGDEALTPVGPIKGDDVEWVVVLKGKRLDIEQGHRLKARGALRVVDHPAAVVNGVIVPAWTEVRVVEQ